MSKIICSLNEVSIKFIFGNTVNIPKIDIEENTINIFCGRNGIGKTLTLDLIAGVEKNTSGEITRKFKKSEVLYISD